MASHAVSLNGHTEMAAGDLRRILDAVSELKAESSAAFATFRAELGFMSVVLKDLGVKVERLEDQKAARVDLTASEARFDRTVADVRAAAATEASRNNREWTERLDTITEDVREIRVKVDDLDRLRWKVMGASTAIGALLGSAIGYLFHLLPH